MSVATFLRRRSQNDLSITAVDTTNDTFTVADDQTQWFDAGGTFAVTGSTGNNATWTVDSVSLSAGDTVVTVTGDITDATADGTIESERYEFLFFTAEDHTLQNQERLISPNLPGKNSGEATGEDSINFILNLGWFQSQIQIGGFFVAIDAADYLDPTTATPSQLLTADPVYITGQGFAFSAANQTAGEIRHAAHDFFYNQSGTPQGLTINQVVLGWGDWDGPASADFTLGGLEYRLWEGNITNIMSRQIAGEPDQYLYKIDFLVGDV